ncbi:MAG: cytochrome-c peroxidase [Chitinophagales bacterium]|nr:cytochrome-c peroxidase [Chitinophagales bacterium]
MKYIKYIVLLLILVSACKKEESIEEQALLNLPEKFGTPKYNLNNNPITQEGFELGRKLFYDPLLSLDYTISCANCHQQYAGFAHADHDVSHGVDDRIGTRNTLALQNLIWKNDFFWDGGVFNLDLVPLNAITSHVEMDNTIDTIINRLYNNSEYVTQFKNVFGTQAITEATILKALSQFQACLVSVNSRYDQYIAGNQNALTTTEIEGLQLFRQKCAACHTEPFFTDGSFRNNGNNLADIGREAVTLNPNDKGKFKVPSLRNIEYTAPYFHNGIANSLNQVLEHYANGIIVTSTTDSLLINGIAMTDNEKLKIIAFLKSLTDTDFLNDERFIDPH